MVNYISSLNPVIQALIATLFTWMITILGAAIVFFFKKVNKNILDAMLGFAAGVMIAASFWSLLSPSIDMARNLKMTPYLVAASGFLLGGVLLFIGDKVFDHFDRKKKKTKTKSFKRCLMLVLSITLHNIPEGLAVGVSFGSATYGLNGASVGAASLLALGIGLQNFPEGTAVSVPLKAEGMSRLKSFFYGALSGIVEPISAVIGALLVLKVRYLLPFLLAFAAGAMIYVVVEELIPESQSGEHSNIGTLGVAVGFVIMMILDIALG